MSSIWFVKEPEALLDFTINWTDWLAPSDTLASGVFIFLEDDLVLEDEILGTDTHTAWVSGGEAGTIYNVLSHVWSAGGREDEKLFTITIMDYPTVLSTLLPRLRLHLGDMNSASYRYLDEWLMEALKGAVQALERRWRSKYIIDYTTNDIIRNPDFLDFTFESPPVLQGMDIEPIILKASIIVKSGSLENTSWNLGRWQDAEISVSNIEGGKAKKDSIAQDIYELDQMLPPPSKKLTKSTRISFDENSIV